MSATSLPENWPLWALASLFVVGAAGLLYALAVDDWELFVLVAAVLGALGWTVVLAQRRLEG